MKDAWNYIHLLGSCVLAISLYCFIASNEWAFIIACTCGILWEVADEINKRLQLNWWFLDNDGFDIKDILFDLAGVFYASILIRGF